MAVEECSHCSIRILAFFIVVAVLSGIILPIIGFGLLFAPDNRGENKLEQYNSAVYNFMTGFPLHNMAYSHGQIIPYPSSSSTSSNTSTSATTTKAAAPVLLSPSETQQPISNGAWLPSIIVPDLDKNARSMIVATNSTSGINITSFDAAATDDENMIVTVTDSLGITSNITLPPLQAQTVKRSSAWCYRTGDGICDINMMARLCRQQTGCNSAVYEGIPCAPGKSCSGCKWTVTQSAVCIPVIHNNNTGFSASSSISSCKYPFRAEDQPTHCSVIQQKKKKKNNNNNNTQDGDDDQDGQWPLVKIILMLESDPFIVAQNLTRGSMFFPDWSTEAQKELGIGLAVGGGVLLLLAAVIGSLVKYSLRGDHRSSRHFYSAFGQEYIPSSQEYADSVRMGMSYKHSGVIPNKRSTNYYKAPRVSDAESIAEEEHGQQQQQEEEGETTSTSEGGGKIN